MDFISNIVKGHKHSSSEDQPENTPSSYDDTAAAGKFSTADSDTDTTTDHVPSGGYDDYKTTADDTSFGGSADGGYGDYKSDPVSSDFPSDGSSEGYTKKTQVGDSYSDYPSEDVTTDDNNKSQAYSDDPSDFSAAGDSIKTGRDDYAGDVSYSNTGAAGGGYSSRVDEDTVSDPQSGGDGGYGDSDYPKTSGRYSSSDY